MWLRAQPGGGRCGKIGLLTLMRPLGTWQRGTTGRPSSWKAAKQAEQADRKGSGTFASFPALAWLNVPFFVGPVNGIVVSLVLYTLFVKLKK